MFLSVKGESQKIMVCEPGDTLDVIERLCGEDIAQDDGQCGSGI